MAKINSDTVIHVFARIFSTILSPLLMPSLGIFMAFWATVLCYIPTGTRLMVLLVIFGITCIMPMVVIAVLHNLKLIEDKRLVNRKERWMPYLATVLCYAGSAVYLYHIHTPQWAVVFLIGGRSARLCRFAHSHFLVEDKCAHGRYRRIAGFCREHSLGRSGRY